MLYRCLAALLLAAAACSRSAATRAPEPTSLPIPSIAGDLPRLCQRPAYSLAEAQALLDTIAAALGASGTPPGAYVVEPLPRAAAPRLASFAMRGDTAVISVGDTVGGHSLYHELVHAWAARLAPSQAQAMVESVFAADRIAAWEPEVTRWAAASYLSVVNGLGHPRAQGLTATALGVAVGALDTTAAGRLTRLHAALGPIVAHVPALGESPQTIGGMLEEIATYHWEYAGFARPRRWDGAAERRFILASEVLAYARERLCVRG